MSSQSTLNPPPPPEPHPVYIVSTNISLQVHRILDTASHTVVGRTGRTGHAGHTGHNGHNGHNGHTGHNGYNGHNDHTSHTGHTDHTGHTGHSGHTTSMQVWVIIDMVVTVLGKSFSLSHISRQHLCRLLFLLIHSSEGKKGY